MLAGLIADGIDKKNEERRAGGILGGAIGQVSEADMPPDPLPSVHNFPKVTQERRCVSAWLRGSLSVPACGDLHDGDAVAEDTP